MKVNQLDSKHPRITTGQGHSKLESFANTRPFLQQIDVIFPSNSDLENAFSVLKKSRYAKGEVSLVKLAGQAAQPGGFVKTLGYSSDISLLSMPGEDVWCIDNRGVLTLSVSGDTYQTLGLVGKRVSFGKGKAKEGDGRHVITLPLQPHTESEKNRERRNESLKGLEERRRRSEQTLSEEGSAWRVLCSSAEEENLSKFIAEHFNESEVVFKDIHCETFRQENVKIPIVRIAERPELQSPEFDGQFRMLMEDYEESIQQLLEWIGMAGLNSQRLQANDRVDPFVAVYETPSPDGIGALTHFRWTGLLSPSFVQSVIDCVMKQFHSPASGSRDPQFVSIVGHACTWSPVCYIPPSLLDSPECTPIRDLSKDEEDTWCLVFTSGSSPRQRREEVGRWLLAESVGKHDKRWG